MNGELDEQEKMFVDRVDDAIRLALRNDVEPTFVISALSALEDRVMQDFSEARAEEMVERTLQGEDPTEVLNDLINEMGGAPKSVALNHESMSPEEKEAMKTLGFDPVGAKEGDVTAIEVEDPTEAEKEALRTLGLME